MARKNTKQSKKKHASRKKLPLQSSKSRRPSDSKQKAPGRSEGRSSPNPPSEAKLWLFRLLLIVIPLLLLGVLEVALHLFDYGVPTSFALKQETDGQKRVISNPYFVWRFMGPRFAAAKGTHFALPLKKPENTYRIFILGASAAQGFPAPDYGIARMLDVLVKNRYPGVVFEVVNAASPAINSHVVLPIIQDCRRLQPDLFILYLGNNEVVGPYGPGTVFSPLVSSIHLIRTGIALRASRMGQLLAATLPKASWLGQVRSREFKGMASFIDHHVRHTDPGMEIVYSHFESNLRDICRVAVDSSEPIIVSTVGANLKDCAPFSSLHRSDLTADELHQFRSHVKAGQALQEQGKFHQAIEEYRRAERIDSEYAELVFRLGKSYWSIGDYDKAKAHFGEALELDALRFRADQQINEIIRDVARNRSGEGIHLVDLKRVIEANSPHETPGNGVFYEHVHMTFHGTYLVARSLLEKMQQVLPTWIQLHAPDGVVLSEDECARRLAYTGWDRLRITEALISLMEKPPFTSQLDNTVQLRELSRKAERLEERYSSKEGRQEVLAQFRSVLAGNDVHYLTHEAYAEFQYRALDNPREAEKHLRRALQQCPQSVEEMFFLSEVLSHQGKHEEAKSYLSRALELAKAETPMPQTTTAGYSADVEKQWKNLYEQAVRLREQKHYQEGTRVSQKALALAEKTFGEGHPRVGMCLNNLASLLKGQGDFAEAEALYKRSLAIVESTAGKGHLNVAIALNNLAGIYVRQGRLSDAEPLYIRALSIAENALGKHHPKVGTILTSLAACSEAMGKRIAAEEYSKRAHQIRSRQQHNPN